MTKVMLTYKISQARDIPLHYSVRCIAKVAVQINTLFCFSSWQLQPDVSHKPGGRLPLLFARPAFTLATLMRAAASFAAW